MKYLIYDHHCGEIDEDSFIAIADSLELAEEYVRKIGYGYIEAIKELNLEIKNGKS